MADEANEGGKTKALKHYKIMAVLQGLLCVGMLACGITAAVNVDENGPPYFVGGFICGVMALLAAVMCTCVVMKAPGVSGESGDVQKQELRCKVRGHYFVSVFMILGCFAGTTLAGIGGFGFSQERSRINKILAPIILVGCIVGIFYAIASLCIILAYGGRYFGVDVTRKHTGVPFMTTGPGQFTGVTTNATAFQSDFGNGMGGMEMGGMGMSGFGNNSQIAELEIQNQLLQQQLELQRQLNEQQQQKQPQYGGGFAQPPPQLMFNTVPAYPPSAPPPSYDDVKQ